MFCWFCCAVHSELSLYAVFAKNCVRLSPPNPRESRLQGGCTLREPLPMAPCPYHRRSATGACDHVFSNKSSKKVYWWHFAYCHSRFQRQYIDFECKNLVSQFGQENIWSAWLYYTILLIVFIILFVNIDFIYIIFMSYELISRLYSKTVTYLRSSDLLLIIDVGEFPTVSDVIF